MNTLKFTFPSIYWVKIGLSIWLIFNFLEEFFFFNGKKLFFLYFLVGLLLIFFYLIIFHQNHFKSVIDNSSGYFIFWVFLFCFFNEKISFSHSLILITFLLHASGFMFFSWFVFFVIVWRFFHHFFVFLVRFLIYHFNEFLKDNVFEDFSVVVMLNLWVHLFEYFIYVIIPNSMRSKPRQSLFYRIRFILILTGLLSIILVKMTEDLISYLLNVFFVLFLFDW